MFCGSLNRMGMDSMFPDLWVYRNQTSWCHNPVNRIVYHVLI